MCICSCESEGPAHFSKSGGIVHSATMTVEL
jgi:hypothetical protein